MSSKINNSKPEGCTPLERLQQIRMGAHDRLLAEAHFARAEFLADVLIGSIDFVRRGLRTLVLRPFRRITAALT